MDWLRGGPQHACFSIAVHLDPPGRSPASVHVTNLLAKLGVHSRLEAAAMARRLGWSRPPAKGRESGPST